MSGWGALYGPQGTDAAVLARLGDAVRKGVASDEFRKVAEAAGLTPATSSSQELVSLMQADIALWRDLANRGIRLHD